MLKLVTCERTLSAIFTKGKMIFVLLFAVMIVNIDAFHLKRETEAGTSEEPATKIEVTSQTPPSTLPHNYTGLPFNNTNFVVPSNSTNVILFNNSTITSSNITFNFNFIAPNASLEYWSSVVGLLRSIMINQKVMIMNHAEKCKLQLEVGNDTTKTEQDNTIAKCVLENFTKP